MVACALGVLAAVVSCNDSPSTTAAASEGPIVIASENPCQGVLLQTIPAACQQQLVLNLTSPDECKFVCSLCLSAVLTVSAGPCGVYAELQANFSARCQWCFTEAPSTTTAAPLPTTEGPTGTGGLTTAAQGSPTPTTEQTAEPTSEPTVGPARCDDVLVRIAGNVCGQVNLSTLVQGNFTEDQCHWVCAPCLSAVLGVPGCYCEAYENLQAHVVQQCLGCYNALSTTAHVTTESPTTTAGDGGVHMGGLGTRPPS